LELLDGGEEGTFVDVGIGDRDLIGQIADQQQEVISRGSPSYTSPGFTGVQNFGKAFAVVRGSERAILHQGVLGPLIFVHQRGRKFIPRV
jgi:hypothetical protein